MHGRDGEMAGVAQFERGFHGFAVADFADQDDVRCFAQGRSERAAIAQGVDADFALIDDGLEIGVREFYRVLDGEDVAAHGAVALVDHGGKRG